MFRFADPTYFKFILLLLLLIALIPVSMRWRRKSLQRFGNLALLQTPSLSRGLRWLRIFLLMVSILLLIISLARPQIGSNQLRVKRAGFNIIFALDTSKSMLAEDVSPSRLARSKAEIIDFVSRLENDNIGLIAFAGSAYLQVPLTGDYSAIEMFLDDIDTNIIPDPGTVIDQAINVAVKAFSNSKQKTKILVLISDGEDHSDQALKSAQQAAQRGLRIYVVGVGTSDGSTIPLRGLNGALQGYKKDRNGNIVVSKLNREVLQSIAKVSDGKYLELSNSPSSFAPIYKDIQSLAAEDLKEQSLTQHGEWFQLILIFVLGLLLLESLISERRVQ